jgi:EmrB/QacA subfamily drug resistance transporter
VGDRRVHLTLAALVLTAGSLADRFGRRRLFAVGLAVFSLSSLLAGLAPDPTFLNLARAVQGVGGAILFAVSLALIAHEFPAGRERGRAMALFGATIGVAVAIGPLVGGALTDRLGWESIFLINVPIGAAAIAVTRLRLRESRDPNASSVDWAGLLTFSGALFLLVLALFRGNDEGWGSAPIVFLLAGAAVLLAAFVAAELRVREPMLPLELFRRPAFTGVQLAALAVSASMFALFLYLTLYLQNYLGHSPLEAGVRYLPITVTVFLVAPVAGSLLPRVPARLLMSAGLALAGVGLLVMSGLDADSDWTALLPGFLLAGAGVGLLNPVIADVAMSVVPRERSGMAAGINDTCRQVGVAVGIAAWVRSSSGAAPTTPRSSVPKVRGSWSRPRRRGTSTLRWRACRRPSGKGSPPPLARASSRASTTCFCWAPGLRWRAPCSRSGSFVSARSSASRMRGSGAGPRGRLLDGPSVGGQGDVDVVAGCVGVWADLVRRGDDRGRLVRVVDLRQRHVELRGQLKAALLGGVETHAAVNRHVVHLGPLAPGNGTDCALEAGGEADREQLLGIGARAVPSQLLRQPQVDLELPVVGPPASLGAPAGDRCFRGVQHPSH